MKSQLIKVRNLPQRNNPFTNIHVKPVAPLLFMTVVGAGLVVGAGNWSGIGMVVLVVGLFGLCMMPDRVLMQIGEDYLVLFNQRDRSMCTIVYWEDLVHWQYEYHPIEDQVVLQLVDGSTVCVEMYSRRKIAKLLGLYAANKEVRMIRG